MALLFASVLAFPAGAGAQEATTPAPPPQPPPEAQPPTKPTVVKQVRVIPAHYKKTRQRFAPWAQPSVRQVYIIVAHEAKKWGVAPHRLHRRIGCESGHRWWIINSLGYAGLGQFGAETFRRGMRSIRTRKVKLVRTKVVWLHTRIVKRWSDGKRTVRRGYKVRVRRTRVRIGWIPKWPPRTHGWAQVRIMAQALRGTSFVGNGEWVCAAKRGGGTRLRKVATPLVP